MKIRPDPLQSVMTALAKPASASSDFDLSPGVVLPENRKIREAGVMIALLETGRGFDVILTKRSSALKHHPGQISFPGGKVDEGDDGAIGAALREADEEIGLKPENVQVLGVLETHETVTGFLVTPVVTKVLQNFTPMPEAGEVAEVFRVPLEHVTALANFQIQGRVWGGIQRHYNVVPFGPYYIWGATARILHGLAQRIAQ